MKLVERNKMVKQNTEEAQTPYGPQRRKPWNIPGGSRKKPQMKSSD